MAHPLQAASPNPTHPVPHLHLQFQVPAGFDIGRFRPDPLPPGAAEAGMKPPFQNAVVLVEPDQLKGFDLKQIPVGEIPVIWLDIHHGREADFYGSFLLPDYKRDLAGHTVYRLPGFPGPYGDQVFYYLVPVGRQRLLEIGAHRYYFRDPAPEHPEGKKETDYDQVIETLVPTLKNQKP